MDRYLLILTLTTALITLLYTFRTYKLKSGARIKGTHSIKLDSESHDPYVSSYTLENLKDRSIVIFASYLKLESHCYLLLEDFEKTPLLLKPFETYVKEFGPIDMYTSSLTQVSISELLKNVRGGQNLVLSTSEGKYTVTDAIRIWNPSTETWKNSGTTSVRPRRLKLGGKYYGSRVRYVLELRDNKEYSETIAIHDTDIGKKILESRLTKEALSSKESLREFIKNDLSKAYYSTIEYSLHDLNSIRKSRNKLIHPGFKLEISKKSYFDHMVSERLGTVYIKYKVKFLYLVDGIRMKFKRK